MDKKDSAISVVLIFVMVLAILAVVIATWALIGIPSQVDEINYHNSFTVENGLGDLQSMMYSMFNYDRSARGTSATVTNSDNIGLLAIGKSGMVNVISSMFIPVGTASTAAKLQVKKKVGTFSGTGYTSTTNKAWKSGESTPTTTIDIDRISVLFGKDSEIGLEGGGVFRRDGDSAQWVIRPFFDTYNEYDYAILVPRFFDVSSELIKGITSNGDVSINVWYTGTYHKLLGTHSSEPGPHYAITYTTTTTDENWDTFLWYNYFMELMAGDMTEGSAPLVEKVQGEPDSGSFTVKLAKGIRSPEFGIELTPLTKS